MGRLKFPKIVVDVTLDKPLKCDVCPAVIRPFSIVHVRYDKADKPRDFLCEACLKKEIEQRVGALRDQHATKKVG